jgi:XRE family aerobic/anaerobic benzoate catabolism transcriptional regulator
LTVWVRAKPDDHMNRVVEQGDLRPITGNTRAMDDLVAILASREPLYAKADLTLETGGQTPEQSLRGVLKLLGPMTAEDRASVAR